MNSLNSWLPTQWILLACLLLVVGLILTLVAIYARRAISRPHLKRSAKNGRQTRLDLVDTFPVDRDRQLVLVRRDNVEHLLMIGGPNDLLVESTILKARPAGQAPRPTGAAAPAPIAVPERATNFPPAPRQVEEDFARSAEVEPPPVAKVEVPPPPAAPATTVAPVTPPATATPGGLGAKPSVVPPREPGFFQRATSRFPTLGRAAPTAASIGGQPASKDDEDEPRATIDTAHFEELLGAAENETVETATSKPVAEFDFDGTDIEPAPDDLAPVAPPAPTTTRLTLPEIRLPDLKLPEWRRPEPPATTEAPAAPTTRSSEGRVEPRFSTEPRPLGAGRIEPTLAPSEPRTYTEGSTRQEPFRIGERLTTPTRPTTTLPPATTTTPAPVEQEDPFASLEEEMANLLGRTRDEPSKS